MGRVLVFTVGIMLMTVILVQSILLLIPFVKRAAFDSLCFQYAVQLIREDGLEEYEKVSLINDLGTLGLEELENCYFGNENENELAMDINTVYPMKIIGSDLKMEEVMLPLSFKLKTSEAFNIYE